MTDLPLVKTSDINLASALLCIGFSIMGIDNRNSNRVLFYFKKEPELARAIESYWDKSLKVNPLDLANSRREILSRIHENKSP